MDFKLIIIIGFSYLYAIFEVFMNLRQNKRNSGATSGDKGSLWLLYILITVGYALSFAIGATKIGRMPGWNTFFAIGFVLVAIGLWIRISSILTLNKYFNYSVATVGDQPLIETGLYHSVRHPGYLGQILIFIGISLSLSNWISVLLMMIPVGIGYIRRMNVEEKFMAQQMGEKYIAYQKRTRRMIPFIY